VSEKYCCLVADKPSEQGGQVEEYDTRQQHAIVKWFVIALFFAASFSDVIVLRIMGLGKLGKKKSGNQV
jgi:hypothetical protein